MAKSKRKKIQKRKQPKTEEEYIKELEKLDENIKRLERENEILRRFNEFADKEDDNKESKNS